MSLQIRLGERTYDLSGEGGSLTLDGKPLDASFESLGPGSGLLFLDGKPHVTSYVREGDQVRITVGGITQVADLKDETAQLLERFGFADADTEAVQEIRAPMPGLVLHVMAVAGQIVEKEQGLVVLEAMKMENELRTPVSGKVTEVHVVPGDAVGKNDLLIELDTGEDKRPVRD